jgi:DNA-binding MarR family transcriptional regulator
LYHLLSPMNSVTGLTLTAIDRVLIHLKDNLHHETDREFPLAITQKGISDATGLRLTHIPRTIKSLEDRELVTSTKGHVTGEKRRYNAYFLTGKGLEETNAILEHLKSQVVATPKGNIKVSEILASNKGHVLPVLRELAGDADAPVKASHVIAGLIPEIGGFVNRQHELEELGNMLGDQKIRVMAIYGSLGYGTSALASKFVRESCKRWSVAWVEVRKDLPDLTMAILNTVSEALPGFDKNARTPKKIAEQLDGKKLILVLDCYFEVSDETVEFLTGFVAAIKSIQGFKLLVTAREDTPPYNRFYTLIDQHDGTVGEVHIRGLDIQHCQIMLGTPDIDPDAMKRLFLFTRGKPLNLKLLARGNEKELRQHTSFSPEEIKLMLFLKGQKKE